MTIVLRLKSEDGVTARVMIDPDTGRASCDDESEDLQGAIEAANYRAGGPAPWKGPLEHLREWAEENGHQVRVDEPEFPSDDELPEGAVY